MDTMNKLKSKFLNIINKPKNVGGGVRPVRVNLPASLGGGFTMLMCFMDGGQTVTDFLRALISMLQSTSSTVLHVRHYGLTPHDPERDEADAADAEEAAARRGPAVFLHPDSLLADAFTDELELNLDLRRLKSLRKGAAADDSDGEERSHSHATSDAASASASGAAAAGASNPFRVPALPTPPSHTVLHYTCLSKLRRLRPPPDPPAEVIVVSTLAAPCTLPFHLARSLPSQLQTAALTSSLSARQASNSAREAAAGSSTNIAAGASSSAASAAASAGSSANGGGDLSRKDRREQAKRAKQLDEYAAHIYDNLLARGVGEDPHLKLQVAAQLMAASKARGERIGTSTAATAGAEKMWGGWEDEALQRARSRGADADMLEVPLLFVRTEPMPHPTPKKFDVTDDCFVITNQRALQISRGVITTTLALGPESGCTIKIPREAEEGEQGRCPLRVLVKDAARCVQEEREEQIQQQIQQQQQQQNGDSDDGGGGGVAPAAGAGGEDRPSWRHRRATRAASAPSRLVEFTVPNPDIAGYLEEYLLYTQEKSLLETQLGLVEQARLDRAEHAKVERCLRGWTMLLKSLVGPIIFGPLRAPSYRNSIKQVLAKVQQMELKQVKITSLKLLEFHLPQLDDPLGADAGAGAGTGADGDAAAAGGDGDQIPSLRLSSYEPHPVNEYVFDIYWSAPSFAIKVEIAGKKLVSFKLQLEMRGVEVRGSIRLRSSPYEPEKSAVSFVSLPHLSFGVGSHVIVGSIKLPFQRAIEKLIYSQIQAAIEAGLRENVVGDKWLGIYYEKSGLGLLLDRWSGLADYPFRYDGTDDEDMMSLALVVTSQAETGLADTLAQMKINREKMQACLGLGHHLSPPPNTTQQQQQGSHAHSRNNSSSSGGGAGIGPSSSSTSAERTRAKERLSKERDRDRDTGRDSPPTSASKRKGSSAGTTRASSRAAAAASSAAAAVEEEEEDNDGGDDAARARGHEDDAAQTPPRKPSISRKKPSRRHGNDEDE